MGNSFSDKNKIIRSGTVQLQYGLNATIFERWFVITATEVKIFDNKLSNNPLATISLNNILNIDVSNNNSFQILFNDKTRPIVYIYCKSKKDKTEWVNMMIKLCPNFLLTKELEIVKQSARKLGFNEKDIENALIKYHQTYGSAYNIHVFIAFLLKNRSKNKKKIISDQKEEEEENKLNDLKCCICHQIYTNPVRNIYDKLYCLNCISIWYSRVTVEQTVIRDPVTNLSLPQHCRLLIPHFNMRVNVWNYNHLNKQFDNNILIKLKINDDKLNEERKKILKYLLKCDKTETNASKIADILMDSDCFQFKKNDLNLLLNESMECYKCLNNIQKLIKDSVKIYNNEIKRILTIVDDNNSDLFQWKTPKWDTFIDKNCKQWTDIHQVDEAMLMEILTKTQKTMEYIVKLIENNKTDVNKLKEEIINVILLQQKEYVNSDVDVQDIKQDDKLASASSSNDKYEYVDVERIFYSEKNGLVNTRCIREITDCLKNNRVFELYHNDITSKSMNRDKLIRFLETAGMDGIRNQHEIYKNYGLFIKNKLLSLSTYLKTLDDNSFNNYFPYWKYLTSITLRDPQIIDPKDWNENNDKIELEISFSLDYDDHLAKYNNNRQKLSEIIQKQMMKHLQLNCLDKYIQITDVEKGSIKAVLIMISPYIALVGGCLWFGYDIYKYNTKPNYIVPWYRTVGQCAIVGGSIGGIIASTIGVKASIALFGTSLIVPFGPIGAIIAGVVVGGLCGIAIWKWMKRKKNHPDIQNQAPPNLPQPQLPQPVQPLVNDDINDEKQPLVPQIANCNVAIRRRVPPQHNVNQQLNDQPGSEPGVFYQNYRASIENIKQRIRLENDRKYWIKLDCGCEIPYDPQSDQTEGNYAKCKLHNDLTCLTKIITTIQNGDYINNNDNNNKVDTVTHVVRSWSNPGFRV